MPEFPTDPSLALVPLAVAFFCIIVTGLLKGFVKRWVKDEAESNLWIIGMNILLGQIFAVTAQLVVNDFEVSAQQFWTAVVVGVFGAGLAALGADGVINLFRHISPPPPADA